LIPFDRKASNASCRRLWRPQSIRTSICSEPPAPLRLAIITRASSTSGARASCPPLAETLAPAAGLRTRLVHEYDVIDDAIVLDAVGRARHDFAAYVSAIERYLAARGV
jgi:hypothetical protein